MKSLINMLKKDETAFSIGRVCSIASFVLWAVITIYLVLLNRTWMHYDSLCICSFSFLLIQLCNKAVESKLFTVKDVKDNVAGNPSK